MRREMLEALKALSVGSIKKSKMNIEVYLANPVGIGEHPDVLGAIQDQIEITIQNFEPRVENVVVEVEPRPDLNEFEVTVIFDIVGQELPTQEFTFILEATR